MSSREIETVLANWIGEALSGPGRIPEGSDPSAWVASRFIEWWKVRAEDALSDAELAATGIRSEFDRLGGWEAFGEALHEHAHLRNALADLRNILGLDAEV